MNSRNDCQKAAGFAKYQIPVLVIVDVSRILFEVACHSDSAVRFASPREAQFSKDRGLSPLPHQNWCHGKASLTALGSGKPLLLTGRGQRATTRSKGSLD